MGTIKEKLSGFNSELPLEWAKTIPSLWYFDSEIYALEREKVFFPSWQIAGRTDQVIEPGQYFTLEIAGEPIAVVRGGDGVLRAFSNVCRHRGARVACGAQGKVPSLRCRYHGWTYDLNGELKGTPEFDGVQDFARADHGLPQLRVDTWGPFVFVNVGKSTMSLAEYLEPLKRRTEGLGIERLKFHERREYVLNCNWKVYIDNYLDGGYHINTIHPGPAGVVNYTTYRSEVEGQTSVQLSPLRNDRPGSATVASVRSGDMAYYWWLFPNFMLNIYEGVMDSNAVYPLGPGSCRVVFDFFFGDEISADYRRQSLEVAEQVQVEDIEISEDVQKGLQSQTYNTGRFSARRELPGYYFHQMLAKWLRS